LPSAVERQLRLQRAQRQAANQQFKLPLPHTDDRRLEMAQKTGHDQLNMTPGTAMSTFTDYTPYSTTGTSIASMTPRTDTADTKDRLRSALRSLPKPRNDYELAPSEQ
jgi:hypothetical protein